MKWDEVRCDASPLQICLLTPANKWHNTLFILLGRACFSLQCTLCLGSVVSWLIYVLSLIQDQHNLECSLTLTTGWLETWLAKRPNRRPWKFKKCVEMGCRHLVPVEGCCSLSILLPLTLYLFKSVSLTKRTDLWERQAQPIRALETSKCLFPLIYGFAAMLQYCK